MVKIRKYYRRFTERMQTVFKIFDAERVFDRANRRHKNREAETFAKSPKNPLNYHQDI